MSPGQRRDAATYLLGGRVLRPSDPVPWRRPPGARMSVTIEERPPRPSAVAVENPVGGRDRSQWAPNERINKRSSIPFILLHFLPLLAFVTGVTWRAVALAVALYAVRMLAITGG